MSGLGGFVELTKPKVVVLLQITAICSIIVHDCLDSSFGLSSFGTMAIVFIGGFLSAGGANAINMWYDRDIDPLMKRTEARPIPSGAITPNSALIFGVLISIMGVMWFLILANQVAAFWSAFSILFYVFVYSIWLKRSTPQNIVIGGIAGSTPPIIGWAAAEGGLGISTGSFRSFLVSIIDIGSMLPWLMFLLIFLWTPPHFWALALYRSKEYASVGVPMLPNVKGPHRTLMEMKAYAILLVLVSLTIPVSFGGFDSDDAVYHILGWTVLLLSLWYASTIWRIDFNEEPDQTGRIKSAASSFYISMLYLALMFVVLVAASFGLTGAMMGGALSIFSIFRNESKISN